MRFCPKCGTDVYSGAVPQAPPPAALPQYPPYAYPYPVVPMPYGPLYGAQWTGGRIATVAGGVIAIIDACLAMILGSAFLLSWFYSMGGYLILAASIAIAGAVTLFLARIPYLGIAGPIMLIAGGLWVALAIPWAGLWIGTIGLVLAAVSLALVAVGWRDTQNRMRSRLRGQTLSMHPAMPIGAPPPPQYGRGPGGLK